MLFLNDWDHQVGGTVPPTSFIADARRLLMSCILAQRLPDPLLLTTVLSTAPTPTMTAATVTTLRSRPEARTAFD